MFATVTIGNMFISIDQLPSQALLCKYSNNKTYYYGTQIYALTCYDNEQWVNKASYHINCPTTECYGLYYESCKKDDIVNRNELKCLNREIHYFNTNMFLGFMFSLMFFSMIIAFYEKYRNDKSAKLVNKVDVLSFANPLYGIELIESPKQESVEHIEEHIVESSAYDNIEYVLEESTNTSAIKSLSYDDLFVSDDSNNHSEYDDYDQL